MNDSNHTTRPCPDCGEVIPADAPEGLCRGCILAGILCTDLPPATLGIRCPYCHETVELLAESEFQNVGCPHCDRRFDLVSGERLSSPQACSTHFGRFQLIELVGTGGFGSVWRSRDPALDRVVALKLPHAGQGGKDMEFFLREARAAARLRHPNIVTVHEVGREDDSVYIVSEFVEGGDLSERLRCERFPPRDAARLCTRIAEALQHAHDAGIIHRDLKPSNILVDPEGEPHLTDFGLAKRETGQITLTFDRKIAGTPAYMAPEQVKGDQHEADRRTDIYSLGTILFEILTGERPFRGSSQMLLQQVLTEDPPFPRRLDSKVPRDLEVICLKCLEKSPSRRYPNARELAEDLGRFLRGEPIRARRVTSLERCLRWASRNSALATLSGALAVGLVVGFVAVSLLWLRAEREMAEKHRLLYASDMTLALEALRGGRMDEVIRLLEMHRSGVGESDLRGFEWYHLQYESTRASRAQSTRVDYALFDVSFSPDGATLIGGGVRQIIALDAERFARKATFDVSESEATVFAIHDTAFSPSGRVLASCGGGGQIQLWDPATGRKYRSLREHVGRVTSISFSPDGFRLASSGSDGTVRIWTVETGRLVATVSPHRDRVETVLFSPDGSTLASAGTDGTVALIDASAEFETRAVLDRHLSPVRSLAFSADGSLLASGGSGDHAILLWDPATGDLEGTLFAHRHGIGALAFAPAESLLASAGDDNTVRFWDTRSQQLLRTLRGHSAPVSSVVFSPDGETLASADLAAYVKLWPVERIVEGDRLPDHRAIVWSIAFSPSSDRIATGAGNRVVRVFDRTSGDLVREWVAHEGAVQRVRFSRDGRRLVTGSHDGTARVWKLETGTESARIQLKDESDGVGDVLFLDGEQTLATLATSGKLQVWRTADGGLVRTLGDRPPMSLGLAYSARDQLLAAGAGNRVELWNVVRGELRAVLAGEHGHNAPISTLAFSPDGRTIASGGRDGAVIIWDVEARSAIAKCLQHTAMVWCVDFSPDGRNLASGSMDKSVLLWDAATGERRGTVVESQWSVMACAFSPDGSILAVSEGSLEGGRVRLLRAGEGRSRRSSRRSGG